MSNSKRDTEEEVLGPLVEVEWKFKLDKTIYREYLTMEQYENLKEIPIVKYCKIIDEKRY
ncbi:hypothetical protein [Nitrosopumilus ureiphilus]|uniref:Uncharacterized protein n=1 Tax=Nitrosopumilus ureiphilus TaxID=1470067 RepID=A0A7D5MB90_9ARCH|nr:hypothetical protein [Nitrosopumilus ureiphilus]QLH07529.1 hypothetical protein C5F50_10950 [Nitrosopumilus ureiphilus]